VSADEIASLGIIGSRSRCIAALAEAVRERTVVWEAPRMSRARSKASCGFPVSIVDGTVYCDAGPALARRLPGTDLMLLRAAG